MLVQALGWVEPPVADLPVAAEVPPLAAPPPPPPLVAPLAPPVEVAEDARRVTQIGSGAIALFATFSIAAVLCIALMIFWCWWRIQRDMQREPRVAKFTVCTPIMRAQPCSTPALKTASCASDETRLGLATVLGACMWTMHVLATRRVEHTPPLFCRLLRRRP